MKKLTLLLPLLLLAGCTSTPSQTDIEIPRETPKADATACNMDAKACPDGSYVGRTGPNCEFAPCPSEEAPVACTEEAKLCPDGSSVSRVGQNCEFPPCPATGEKQNYTVVDRDLSLGTCTVDTDCPTPTDYLIRSNCPYTSKCLENTCFVVCPKL